MVSIVMPAYNAAGYLNESVESVVHQTYGDWELLILDDASEDGTAQMATEWMQRDARIRYVKNEENLGVAATRNRGVALAKGEWIAFLDSDDAWEPEKLNRQLETAKRQQSSFLFTGSAFMDEMGKRLDYILTVPERIGFGELAKQNVVSCSSVLIRKELIAVYPMQGRRIHEDFVVWLRILKERKMEAVGVNEPLLIYRLSAASKSGNKWKAAGMNWRVYREIQLPLLLCCYYQWCYAVRGLKKYAGIRKSRRISGHKQV